jgi:hypothetical protein
MNAIFGILLQGAGALILTASAQSPAAVVEELAGSVPGVQFMDYVDPGQVIRLGAHDRIVLGYLKSCWRETISGGTVTVGTEQSEVAGGEVARAKVACEGGKMMLSAELAGKSGAMVFRQAPKLQAAALPHPQFTLYGLSPVFEVRPPGKLVVERLDQPGERHEIAVTEQQTCAARSSTAPRPASRSLPAESTGLNSPTRRSCSKSIPTPSRATRRSSAAWRACRRGASRSESRAWSGYRDGFGMRLLFSPSRSWPAR